MVAEPASLKEQKARSNLHNRVESEQQDLAFRISCSLFNDVDQDRVLACRRGGRFNANKLVLGNMNSRESSDFIVGNHDDVRRSRRVTHSASLYGTCLHC